MLNQELLIASPKGRAIHAVREMIERGALRRGDRLPAEGALAARFNVSRMTLRTALDALESEGLVRRERNLGCICTSSPRAGQWVDVPHHRPRHRPYAHIRRPSFWRLLFIGCFRRDSGHQYGKNEFSSDRSRGERRVLAEGIGCRRGAPGVIMSCWGYSIEWQLNSLRQIVKSNLSGRDMGRLAAACRI